MEGTIGEIRLFAGNFAPRGWALCDGSLQSIAQNTACFSILGTTYGGDGQTTYALPDLRGRLPVGAGQGPGLSNYVLGQVSGTENVTLTVQTMPSHGHAMYASADSPVQNTAQAASLASNTRATNPPMPNIYVAGQTNQVPMASSTSIVGGGNPISIVQPVLGLNYIVCMEGIFPSRN